MSQRFRVVVSSTVRYAQPENTFVNDPESWSEFCDRICEEVRNLPSDTRFCVFPEYCLRKTPFEEAQLLFNHLAHKIPSELVLVLGTVDVENCGSLHNSAVVIRDRFIQYVPKTNIIPQDAANGVSPGKHPGVFQLVVDDIKFAVLVCADLWNIPLCYSLAVDQGADVFLVPCWTSCQKGNRSRVRDEFRSLARTRSLEYGIVVAIADHPFNYPKTDVSNSTCVFSPTDRDQILPHDIVHQDELVVDLADLRHRRVDWIARGLGQKNANVFVSRNINNE